MSDLKTYRGALEAAPQQIKDVLASEQIANLIDKLEVQTTDTINRQEYMILFSDYLVQLSTKEDVELALKKDLGVDLVQPFLKQIEHLKGGSNELAGVVASDPGSTDSSGSPVAPVRTMEDDKAAAQEGQTFTSSQDALLNKQNPHR